MPVGEFPGDFGMSEPATLFDYAAERDAALSRVTAGAGEGFVAEAREFVLGFLAGRESAPGEEMTDACKAAGIVPAKDDRAFGAVYLGLAREGKIVKCGFCLRKKGHGTGGGCIWRLA